MKKFICILLITIFIAALLCACQSANEPATDNQGAAPEDGFISPVEFAGCKVGIVKNYVTEKDIIDNIENPVVVSFDDIEAAFTALKNGEIDGLALPELIANNYLAKEKTLATLPFAVFEREICALGLTDSKFQMPSDATITSLRDNGTLNRIALAHSPLGNPVDPYERPSDYETLKDRVITIGINNEDNYPYNYHDENGELCGINVDVAHEIACGVKAELKIIEGSDEELTKALEAGEVDMIMSELWYDETTVIPVTQIYSHPYSTSVVSMIVPKSNISSVPIVTTLG